MWFTVCFTTPSNAQLPHAKASLTWQQALVQRYDRLQKRTYQLARQYQWPLSKNYSNHRVLTLQEVDELGQPVYYTLHNAEAAQGTQTQALYGTGSLPLSLSGNTPIVSGKLGLWDGGRVLASHQEFGGKTPGSSRIVQKENTLTLNNHATHLAGTLIGKGIREQAQGMAFGAQLTVWDYTNDITELTAAAPGLLVSNHSYGPVAGWVYNDARPGTNPDLKWEWWGNTAISTTEDYLFGFYTTKASDLDRIAYNNPFFLMVRSADNKRGETGPPAGTPYFLKNSSVQSDLPRSRNDAYDVIPGEATAKNVLTVGAANIAFTSQGKPSLLGSAPFSGWGPTDDGRIKPDLLGAGSGIFSTLTASDTTYGNYTGTSMASANVAGSLFLLQELYATKRGPGMPISGQFMRAATLRGLALHTATRPTPAAGPTYQYGWGLLNTEAAARLLLNQDMAHLLLEKNLVPGGTFTQSIVAQGNEPLIVTLSWTDPEASPSSLSTSSLNNRSPKLINDLDLRVTGSQQIDLPFMLDPARPEQAAKRGDNSRDNVEQVYIADPVAGQTYTLVVSQKGPMTYSSQPFSVVVSGLYRVNCQLTTSIRPGKDTTICAGKSIMLSSSAKSVGLQYQWLRDGVVIANARSDSYETNMAGSYLLRVTDANGCSAVSQPIQVQIRSSTLTLTPDNPQWLCNTSDPVQLRLVDGDQLTTPTTAVVDWLRNDQLITDAHSTTLNVTEPGTYQVRLTKDGCQYVSTQTSVFRSSVNEVIILPEETDLILPQGASVTLIAPLDTSYRYQWYRNDQSLINARDYKLSVTQPGVYKVAITQNKCVGWSTDRLVQTTTLTALTPDPSDRFGLYPNPAEHTLSIRYVNSAARQAHVCLFDFRGVLQQPPFLLKAQNGQFEGDISVQHLPPGLYILQLTDGHTTQMERFIKK
ncbi:S8 family serine peptidase [Spirosoma sp.]|uniref:S8 family serine peptidase n=1 Tax=Spirosoma sp. TaxID=1899569 RepID=UPI00262E8D98|nr:S8 family serine peptidase [Spirosoma sp.]MCX6214793.1 S8 family serine peptidase [Spirosoma sp.]